MVRKTDMELDFETTETARPESGLSPEQIDQLKERLLAERENVGRRLAARRQTLANGPSRATDEADWAADSADQGLIVRLVDRDAKLLHEIEAALRRMALGTYGVCTISGEPIGLDRLQTRPWTRHALAAKESVERERVKAPSGVVVPVDDSGGGGDDQAA